MLRTYKLAMFYFHDSVKLVPLSFRTIEDYKKFVVIEPVDMNLYISL